MRVKKRQWISLGVFFLSAILLLKIALFFKSFPQFPYFWDYLGHIQKAEQGGWLPWQRGWDTTYWGGYASLLYPGLSHVILKIFLFITKSREWGVATLVMGCTILMLHALWTFIVRTVANTRARLIAFAISLVLFTLSPAEALASLKGYLFAGPIANMVAVPLFLYFLSARSWLLRGIFLGMLLLTHTMTASLALLYLIFEAVGAMREVATTRVIALKHLVYTGLLGFTIGLPWILPFLDTRFEHEAFNLGGKPYFWGVICLVALVGSIGMAWVKKVTIPLITWFALGVTTLSLLPFPIIKLIEGMIRGIHFYRYYAYAILLTPPAILGMDHLWKRMRLEPTTWVTSIGTVLSGVCIVAFILSPLSYSFTTNWQRIPSSAQGRFIDVANDFDIDLFARTAEHIVPENSHLLGSSGLFFETAQTGVVYGTLKQVVNKESFSIPIYKLYVTNLAQKIESPDRLFQLLGITHQAYTSESNQEGPDNTVFATITITKNSFNHTRYYHLKKVSDTQLIETLDQVVPVDPNLDLWEWWGNPEKPIIAREEVEIPANIILTKPAVTHISSTRDTISFTVDSPNPAPTYIKFSYSPYWTAESASSSGFTTQPIWATPGNMVVYAAGPVILKWNEPPYLRIYGPLSVGTLLISVAIWLSRLRKTDHIGS